MIIERYLLKENTTGTNHRRQNVNMYLCRNEILFTVVFFINSKWDWRFTLLLGFCFLPLYQFDKIVHYSFALSRYDAFRVELNSLQMPVYFVTSSHDQPVFRPRSDLQDITGETLSFNHQAMVATSSKRAANEMNRLLYVEHVIKPQAEQAHQWLSLWYGHFMLQSVEEEKSWLSWEWFRKLPEWKFWGIHEFWCRAVQKNPTRSL